MAGAHVVPEHAAVVDDARDDLDVVRAGGREAQLAGPRLERVEDHHRPVDQLAEALEAADDVEREAVRRAGRDAEACARPSSRTARMRIPDDLARVPRAVGVVQQQHVEGVDAEPLEAALGRHPHVVRVVLGPAQRRMREARKAARPVALGEVEVVADRADDAEAGAIDAGQRATEQLVGLAGSRRRRRSAACRVRRPGAAAPRGAARRPARRNADSGHRSRFRSRCARAAHRHRVRGRRGCGLRSVSVNEQAAGSWHRLAAPGHPRCSTGWPACAPRAPGIHDPAPLRSRILSSTPGVAADAHRLLTGRRLRVRPPPLPVSGAGRSRSPLVRSRQRARVLRCGDLELRRVDVVEAQAQVDRPPSRPEIGDSPSLKVKSIRTP